MSSAKQTLSLEEEDKAPLGRERSITLSQAQFEELYLQPFKLSKMQERNAMTFGNPTLLGLLSFCCTFTPTCCSLMSFGGSTPSTMTAYIGLFYLFGGAIGWLTAIGEFILGNSFSMVTFAGFGSFWMIFGTLNDPTFGIAAALGGPTSPAFLDSVGIFICVFGFFCVCGTLAAIRTNLVFLIVFTTVTIAAELIGVGYLELTRNPAVGANLLKAGGAVGFVTCCFGWYFFAFLLFSSVDLPIALPVGDLSQRIPGHSKLSQA
ncbi:hypothetical protein FA10DRAFT_289343 [Acaromyces ingoldii]|uniref:GPR1/FUN34/yaaH family-domain-containing protein n=1 Tax=Acaromyces ingoldii TaxID=215250 RepID=A0A316YAS7_9BASI|nr:hypothetical protein FA10DRAFT_289343 [Acaromyces ingoldii]PWN86736.1 hypothetical protein FA10DRAFT_289343 [Acaromyces ingoldii]